MTATQAPPQERTERRGTAVDSDLPTGRVIQVVREDPRNPNVLYVGTELGLYVSLDQGQHWVELGSNMPLASIRDIVVHPRDNALVVATRGRGIWILDDLEPLQGAVQKDAPSEAQMALAPARR